MPIPHTHKKRKRLKRGKESIPSGNNPASAGRSPRWDQDCLDRTSWLHVTLSSELTARELHLWIEILDYFVFTWAAHFIV